MKEVHFGVAHDDLSSRNLLVFSLSNAQPIPLLDECGSFEKPRYPHGTAIEIAKSALESVTRYLAADLGQEGIRVNSISAGPIKTLAAAGISGFRKTLSYVGERTPLKRNVDQTDVGKTALYLASDLSSGVTGENIYVDAGFNIMGMHKEDDVM